MFLFQIFVDLWLLLLPKSSEEVRSCNCHGPVKLIETVLVMLVTDDIRQKVNSKLFANIDSGRLNLDLSCVLAIISYVTVYN